MQYWHEGLYYAIALTLLHCDCRMCATRSKCISLYFASSCWHIIIVSGHILAHNTGCDISASCQILHSNSIYQASPSHATDILDVKSIALCVQPPMPRALLAAAGSCCVQSRNVKTVCFAHICMARPMLPCTAGSHTDFRTVWNLPKHQSSSMCH